MCRATVGPVTAVRGAPLGSVEEPADSSDYYARCYASLNDELVSTQHPAWWPEWESNPYALAASFFFTLSSSKLLKVNEHSKYHNEADA